MKSWPLGEKQSEREMLTSPPAMMLLFETERKGVVKKNVRRATTIISPVTAVMIATNLEGCG